MTNHARNGAARERRVRDFMVRVGWVPEMRSAASKGAADLLMSHPIHGAALIQVKPGAAWLSPAARNRLVDAAERCGALALAAFAAPGVAPSLYVVDRGVPSKWERWAPKVIHDTNCGVPTGRTWACACNERNGYATRNSGPVVSTPDATGTAHTSGVRPEQGEGQGGRPTPREAPY